MNIKNKLIVAEVSGKEAASLLNCVDFSESMKRSRPSIRSNDVPDPDNWTCSECLCLGCIYAPCEYECPCDQTSCVIDCVSFEERH